MESIGTGEYRKQLFGMIFLLAQRWQVLGDRELADSGITTKQWLLLVTMQALFTNPPSMNELAQAMGTSRQNVKQLAINLKKKGLIEIFQDDGDKRILRFRLTELNQSFWEKRADRDEQYIESLFANIPDSDLVVTVKTIEELTKYAGLNKATPGEKGISNVNQRGLDKKQDQTVQDQGESDSPAVDPHNALVWADF